MAAALQDIADAIEHIQQFTERMDFDAFQRDLKTVATVVTTGLISKRSGTRSGTTCHHCGVLSAGRSPFQDRKA